MRPVHGREVIYFFVCMYRMSLCTQVHAHTCMSLHTEAWGQPRVPLEAVCLFWEAESLIWPEASRAGLAGWPETARDPPTSASLILSSQMHTTIPGFKKKKNKVVVLRASPAAPNIVCPLLGITAHFFSLMQTEDKYVRGIITYLSRAGNNTALRLQH